MDKHILRLILKILLPVSGWLLFRTQVFEIFYALCDRLADLHAGQSAGAFS